MPTVKLSIGEYEVQTPHLLAWDRILKALDQRHYDAIGRAIAQAVAAIPEDEEVPSPDALARQGEAVRNLIAQATPVLAQVPAAAHAFVEGCLRTQDGTVVRLPDDLIPTDVDLVRLLDALIENNLWGDLLSLVKKRLGLSGVGAE